MSNVAFLWIFSRGMELGAIVLCLLPLRALLRKKVPRLFSYLLWTALPVDIVYNLVIFLIPKGNQWITDYIVKSPRIIIEERTVQVMKWCWIGGTFVVVFGMACSYVVLLQRLVGSVRLQDGVYVTDRIEVPFTFGLVRPKIYLPFSLKEQHYESVILHETVHINRKDIWMKCFAVGLLGLFWFQPILWFAYRLFVNDMEEACDETVLRKRGKEFREEYARSLMELSEQSENVRGVAIGYGNGAIKSRIKNVMHYERVNTKKCALAVLLCCVFIISAVMISWQVPRVVKPSKDDSFVTEMSVAGRKMTKTEMIADDSMK